MKDDADISRKRSDSILIEFEKIDSGLNKVDSFTGSSKGIGAFEYIK